MIPEKFQVLGIVKLMLLYQNNENMKLYSKRKHMKYCYTGPSLENLIYIIKKLMC